MADEPGSRREIRYGVPAADLVLYNRHYVLGYSFYFRQAKWALEIVDPDNLDLPRADNFRPDYRIPEMFRADLNVYKNSGYDRGHLVSSANQREKELQNSETFLLSNMSPQIPEFNRDIWKKLETAVRKLDSQKKILETYVISGPIFDFRAKVKQIGVRGKDNVLLPVPDAYFKSVLTENNRGTLYMWSFIMDNAESDRPLEEFQVPTEKVEQYAGIFLWQNLVGRKIEREKRGIRKMWDYS
ncbi:DNA/RNA non-specific endonuclease [Chloroflexota bacterium]